VAIQSANATVLRVTRTETLSISQLYFASIGFSFLSGVRPICHAAHRFRIYGLIRTNSEKVPFDMCRRVTRSGNCWSTAQGRWRRPL